MIPAESNLGALIKEHLPERRPPHPSDFDMLGEIRDVLVEIRDLLREPLPAA